jgi:hypothetical protein
MNPNDRHVDRQIADALRAASTDEYSGSLDRLAARIDAAVAPMLAARRDGASRTFAWWSYAADWARALIPASVVIAAASIGFLWLLRTSEAAEPPPSAIAAAVSPCRLDRDCTPASAVDKAVEELISATTPLSTAKPR